MAEASLTIRRARADSLADVQRLLEASDLPTDDVESGPGRFCVAYRDGDPVGTGGLECYGRAGLMRSVAVERASRGQGLGTVICDRLEAAAAAEGVRTLYLLTTSAAGFFAARGYVEVDRDAAPAAIQETTEFTDLCPASATCMKKAL